MLQLLGWSDEGKSYERLEQSLNRWTGVTLYYQNAWWNKADRCWVSEKLHVLDNVTLTSPSYAQLQSAADADRVILMLKGYEGDDRRIHTRSDAATHSKLAVTRAILAGGLSRTFVLGATLAQDLLAKP